MRIAVFNAFAGQAVAETELAQRLCLAAAGLGWEAREVGNSVEARSLAPDFVIALHFFTPKLTGHPTYGCMWNPPPFMESDPRYVKNVLSYDGYLSSSSQVSEWLHRRLAGTPKKFFIAPFYASCNHTHYRPPKLDGPRLFYAGTNWDGVRFRDLFSKLDSLPYVDIYGPRSSWRHLRASYRGQIPFDGKSVLETLNRAGVGLCLHREEHRAAGTPSLRVFEIASSGAVGICQDHPFIREAFGDSMLYLDSSPGTPALPVQIANHMRWIAGHHEEALAMSRSAHAIFESRFTLEGLLKDVAREHDKIAPTKGFVAPVPGESSPRAQVVIRAGARSPRTLHRALASLANQTVPVSAIVVRYQDVDLDRIIDPFRGKLPVQIVEGSRGAFRSTHLWEGLRAVSSEYFGVLDDDDALHPNHMACLSSLLDEHPRAGVAYSGAVRVWERGSAPNCSALPVEPPPEPAELVYAEPYDRYELIAVRNYISSNSFLARRVLLDALPKDPELSVLEDLLLLLVLSVQTDFLFSYETTCEFFWRAGRTDNTVLGSREEWDDAADKVSRLFWTEGLLGPGADARLAESYRAALRSSGFAMTRELRRRCEESIRWREECAYRDRLIHSMERSRGWRFLTVYRQTRDRIRAATVRLSRRVRR